MILNCYQKGKVNWHPLVVLALVASTVLFAGLYVGERAGLYERSISVADNQGNTRQEYNWRLVTSWPKNFPGLGMGPEKFAAMVDEMSAGRLQVHVYGAGELVPALGVLDAVSTGSVEMGHSGAYYHKGKIPASPFFSAIPFGMNVLEHNAWIYYGGGLELWREIYEPLNVIPFPGGNTGIQMAGWFNKEINSIEDYRGLKMRIPGIAGEVFSRAGGTAVNIPGGELYTSMQTGVIDATEWVGPYNDRSFGLNEVGEHYYTPAWHEPEAMLEFIVNETAWNSLPEDLQAIVRVAADAVNADMLAEYTARNAQALRDLRASGIEPKSLPNEVLDELKRHALDYYEEESARNEDFARIYQQYREFQTMTYEWLQISEKAMYDYRGVLKSTE